MDLYKRARIPARQARAEEWRALLLAREAATVVCSVWSLSAGVLLSLCGTAAMGNNSVVLPDGFTSGLLGIYWDQAVRSARWRKTAVFVLMMAQLRS